MGPKLNEESRGRPINTFSVVALMRGRRRRPDQDLRPESPASNGALSLRHEAGRSREWCGDGAAGTIKPYAPIAIRADSFVETVRRSDGQAASQAASQAARRPVGLPIGRFAEITIGRRNRLAIHRSGRPVNRACPAAISGNPAPKAAARLPPPKESRQRSFPVRTPANAPDCGSAWTRFARRFAGPTYASP